MTYREVLQKLFSQFSAKELPEKLYLTKAERAVYIKHMQPETRSVYKQYQRMYPKQDYSLRHPFYKGVRIYLEKGTK